jgi:glyoxylase-like metal-dependent hydrolase (beta-lactamase superfamily II)
VRQFFLFGFAAVLFLSGGTLYAQTAVPDWCKPLPRPEYKTLARVKTADPWFEIYKVAPDTFAIYEPHQSEETIAYLILGKRQAMLFDTGMGISDIRKVVEQLTSLPVIVLNSHTHVDHVGGNWQFENIYSMDTDFSRQNAKGSSDGAQEEIAAGQICGQLPGNFDPKTYRTRPWKITKYIHDGDKLDLGSRPIEVIATPGHTPDAICLYDASNKLLFTGDTYYPGAIWLYRPETSLPQYRESVAKLSIRAPEVKAVLGAHNFPVAPPAILKNLATASAELQPPLLQQKGSCKAEGPGKQVCQLEGITFLLAATP